MPRRVRVYLGAAAALAVAIIVPVSVISLSAGASTTACGSACTSPSVQSLGTGEVLEAPPGATSGSSVSMAAASTTNSGEDWTPLSEGTVTNAAGAGIVSSKLGWIYGSDDLWEFQYAPDGIPSDLCLGTGTTSETYDSYSYSGSISDVDDKSTNDPPTSYSYTTYTYSAPSLSVVLAPCGLTSQTLWIIDAGNPAAGNGYVDLISAGYESQSSYGSSPQPNSFGYQSYFAEPAVLTVNSSGTVVLAPLSQLGSTVSATQMWASWSSSAQAELRARAHRSR
jgi:hypothetical protein